jgi:hypothetical protein
MSVVGKSGAPERWGQMTRVGRLKLRNVHLYRTIVISRIPEAINKPITETIPQVKSGTTSPWGIRVFCNDPVVHLDCLLLLGFEFLHVDFRCPDLLRSGGEEFLNVTQYPFIRLWILGERLFPFVVIQREEILELPHAVTEELSVEQVICGTPARLRLGFPKRFNFFQQTDPFVELAQGAQATAEIGLFLTTKGGGVH